MQAPTANSPELDVDNLIERLLEVKGYLALKTPFIDQNLENKSL